MPPPPPPSSSVPAATVPSLPEIARQWGRIGCVGFGGPPAHVALLRDLCVPRRRWLTATQFEHAIGATNLLPGPASTQLAIYCAWRLRGTRGALLGGACFVAPGLVLILALSALFLAGSEPRWLRGAGMGAGAAVAVVALRAGVTLGVPIWARTVRARRPRVGLYALAGGLSAALTGAWLVVVLFACGLAELGSRRATGPRPARPGSALHAWPALLTSAPVLRALHVAGVGSRARAWAIASPLATATAPVAPTGVGALVWTAFKVGAGVPLVSWSRWFGIG
jgi:chromate transporter